MDLNVEGHLGAVERSVLSKAGWLLYLGQAGRSQRPSLTHSDRVEPT